MAAESGGRGVVAMVKDPFRHGKTEHEGTGKIHGTRFGEWLQREDSGVEGTGSSIFIRRHDEHQTPERTCIQGHEIAPGETHCSKGHPAG
ncbi:hypothetical protein [Paenarthrobacter nitroguajacolicus]|uniref:hypothetical protein n=1 Tax=Paenarthrobacter nitroguajacolicus TaxID=211146 RepID=UPI00248CA879|nr:hypothetical protein [Paenarthrobacter nitroguajacolicus]